MNMINGDKERKLYDHIFEYFADEEEVVDTVNVFTAKGMSVQKACREVVNNGCLITEYQYDELEAFFRVMFWYIKDDVRNWHIYRNKVGEKLYEIYRNHNARR